MYSKEFEENKMNRFIKISLSVVSLILLTSYFPYQASVASSSEESLPPTLQQAKEMIGELSKLTTDQAMKQKLEELSNFLVESFKPKLSPEAKNALLMINDLLAQAVNVGIPIETVLKEKVNPLLAYLDSESLEDQAFELDSRLQDIQEKNVNNSQVLDRIIAIRSRIGESSRPVIKKVLEESGARAMRLAMDQFYQNPANESGAQTVMKSVEENPSILKEKPILATLLVPAKSILEKGGKMALDQIPSLMNGLTKDQAISILWKFCHPSLKAPVWIDFFLKLQERLSNLKTDMIVDTAQLGVFQRPMADLLVSEVARNNFNAGLDQLRQAAASKTSVKAEFQKEYETVMAEYGSQSPFDVNKYGSNPAMALLRLSEEDMATVLKNLLGKQMSSARTAFYSLLAFTNVDQRKAFTYLFKTLHKMGALQRQELLNNLPTSEKQRTPSSQRDVQTFIQALTSLPVEQKDAIINWNPKNAPSPSVVPPSLSPQTQTSVGEGVPPPPPPPGMINNTEGNIPPPPPPPPLGVINKTEGNVPLPSGVINKTEGNVPPPPEMINKTGGNVPLPSLSEPVSIQENREEEEVPLAPPLSSTPILGKAPIKQNKEESIIPPAPPPPPPPVLKF